MQFYLSPKAKSLFLVLIIAAGIIISWIPAILPPNFLDSRIGESFFAFGLGIIILGMIELFDHYIPSEDFKEINDKLHEIQKAINPGIVKICDSRGEFDFNKLWRDDSPKGITILGRSVLHRIQKDLKLHDPKQPIEEVIKEKLLKGSRITIIFLDPRSSFIDQLAKEEGKRKEDIIENIGTSLQICKRLYDTLSSVKLSAKNKDIWYIRICLTPCIPYITYTSTENLRDQEHDKETEMVIGFYLKSGKALEGFTQPAFLVIDGNIQAYFKDYVNVIAQDALPIMVWERRKSSKVKFYDENYDQLSKFYAENYPKIKL